MAKVSMGGLVNDASGALGDEVAARGRSGIKVRRKPTYKYPNNPKLEPVHNRMQQAVAMWNTFDRETAIAWNEYGQTITHHNDVNGQPYHPTGFNIFCGLTTKFLQANPDGDIPTLPPTSTFTKDKITLSVSTDSFSLTFNASDGNAPNAVTELLLQPLKNARAAVGSFYKSIGFVAFTHTSRHYIYFPDPGTYACAYRFVNPNTGQTVALVPVGVVQVS